MQKCISQKQTTNLSYVHFLNVYMPHKKRFVAYQNAFLSFHFFQMSTMPGLPTRPCFYDIDLDPGTEEIKGLF